MADLPPRRPPRRPAHRGGAWKVAYADFVTALMALFIVLWIMTAGEPVRKSVSGYFQDPKGYTARLGPGSAGAGEGLKVSLRNISEMRSEIEKSLRDAPEFQSMRDNVKLSVSGEGLRIDLMENEQGMFFPTGSSSPTSAGERLLRMLASEIAKMPNQVAIEGHTDARPFRGAMPGSLYGNWELSAERANAARRLLGDSGLRAEQVAEVRGYADRRLMNPAKPNDARNRRISLVVQFSPDGMAAKPDIRP